MDVKHSILDGILKGRFSLLLSSFALMFFVLPLIPAERSSLEQIFSLFNLVVLLSCLRAVVVNRIFFLFLAGLSVVNVVIGSTEVLSHSDSPGFITTALLLRLVYYLLVFFSIMRSVFDNTLVTGDKICGAISAYLLMGISWAVVYALFHHLEPGSFSIPDTLVTEHAMGMWTIYYSFTTLTTLGYGDITPLTPPAQSYALMEAATGQVFLAVLVARLVALQILHSQSR